MTQHYKKYLKQTEEMTAQSLMRHVRILSDSRFRGRMPGDIGYDLACSYVEEQFREIGLIPRGLDGYRQAFHLETNRILASSVVTRNDDSVSRELKLGKDYVCRGLTGGGSVQGDLVFVGYGSRSESLDELDLDLRGKLAVSFKYPPPWVSTKKPELPREKAKRLRDRGAAGLVLVPNPNRLEGDRLGVSLVESGEQLHGFPIIILSEAEAVRTLDFGDETLASRQYRIDHLNQVVSCPIPGSMKIDIETEWNEKGLCWNLIGLLPGADPNLKEEVVVMGAHLDHVGIQGESVIFPGAQDDASGVATVIETARCFSRGSAPARSMLFIVFGAEEAGIIGSLHYGSNPVWPLEKTKAMLNMDCMGAGTGLDIRGRKHYPDLFEILDEINANVIGIEDTFSDHVAGGADAEAFEIAGVPNMFFVSRQPYQHLHMKSDTAETLNPVVFEKIARLSCLTAAEIADRR